MAQLAVVVTVAAIFLVPTAVGKPEAWPSGDMGRMLDGFLLAALALMTVWVLWILAP